MKQLKLQCLVCLLLFTCTTLAQKTYTLKQNLPIGKKYSFTFISDQIINQKIGEQKYDLTQTIGTDYTFDIRNGDSMEKDIEVIYKRIYLKSIMNGQKTNMDSDDEDTTKQNPFRGMKGAGFNMVMEPNGSIKSLTGVDKMLTTMASKISKDSLVIKKTKLALSKQFNVEGLKQTMEASLKIYPNKPVKIGDSWIVDTQMKMTMPVETTTKYTLKEVKNGIAYLNVDGNLISKGNFEVMGNKMETNLIGTNSGDAELEIKTGLILNSHLRIEMKGTMNAMGQNIDFHLQGINKIVGKEISK